MSKEIQELWIRRAGIVVLVAFGIFCVISVVIGLLNLGIPLVGNIRLDYPTTSPTPSAHNPALEKLVNEFKQAQNHRVVSGALPTFNVIWHNANSVTLETFFSDNPTFPENTTWIAFPTTTDATNYLNTADKSDYRLLNETNSRSASFASQYYNATGYYAQTYRHWYNLGLFQTPTTGRSSITQRDNILEFTTMLIPTYA